MRTAAQTTFVQDFTPEEEVANWVTHGIGFLLSVLGLPLLIIFSMQRGDIWHRTSFTIFGITLVLLYGASTLYHFWRGDRGKRLLQKLDYAAIFLLIAGTYTPFLLVALRDQVGWTLFGVIWTLCAAGAVFQFLFCERFPVISTFGYLFAGWLIVFAFKPMMASVPRAGLALLLAGGFCYTVGVGFFWWRRLRFHHAVWHTFVLGGSLCHFLAVLLFLLPPR